MDCSSSTFATIVSANAYGHRIRRLPDPTADFHVEQLLVVARRLRAGQDQRTALEDVAKATGLALADAEHKASSSKACFLYHITFTTNMITVSYKEWVY